MEVELDDDIANGLDYIQFKSQLSSRDDVWEARQWVQELIKRFEQERPH